MAKTDNPEEVGMHVFQRAGLGIAPFRFVGFEEKYITYPDGSTQASGSCDYCGTGIRLQCFVRSADGKQFKVGCNCIDKVGDEGLIKAYRNSPEYRAHQRKLRHAKDQVVAEKLKSVISANASVLKNMPHPANYTDRATGTPLTALDYATWMLNHCGASGRKFTLQKITQLVGGAK